MCVLLSHQEIEVERIAKTRPTEVLLGERRALENSKANTVLDEGTRNLGECGLEPGHPVPSALCDLAEPVDPVLGNHILPALGHDASEQELGDVMRPGVPGERVAPVAPHGAQLFPVIVCDEADYLLMSPHVRYEVDLSSARRGEDALGEPGLPGTNDSASEHGAATRREARSRQEVGLESIARLHLRDRAKLAIGAPGPTGGIIPVPESVIRQPSLDISAV